MSSSLDLGMLLPDVKDAVSESSVVVVVESIPSPSS